MYWIIIKESYIARDDDFLWLTMRLPKQLSDTSDRIYLLGNPRGYGKSALVAEMAYKRDVTCGKNGFPSGPVLSTDFRGVKTADDAEDKTFNRFSCPPFPNYLTDEVRPVLFHTYMWLLRKIFIYYLLLTFIILDKLPHKLKLVKEVCLELSKEKGENKKVVMWVLESYSTLVSNATRDLKLNQSLSVSAYSGVIVSLFDLNTSIIPVAVCSSATTAGLLSESKLFSQYSPYLIFFDTSNFYPVYLTSQSACLGSIHSLLLTCYQRQSCTEKVC